MTWRLPAPAAGGIVVSLSYRIPPSLAGLGLILGSMAVALSCTPSSNATPAPASPAPPTPAPPAMERSAAPVDTSPGAKTWFMAPDAPCGSGNGTLEKPWCIQDALESRRVKPGDTIEARLGGTYKLREMAGGFVPITATLVGSPDRRITVKPYAPDQTTPTTLIRVACDQRSEDKGVECMSVESSWVDYYDFEVANFGNPQRQRTTGQFDSAGFGTGVRVFADARKNHGVGNRLINWVLHDTAIGVFKSDRANPTDFYGMVVYNYGFLYSLEKVRRTGGHGFYLRNGIEANGRLKNCTSRSGVDDSEPARVSLIDNIVSGAISVKGYGASSLSYQDYGSCECVMHRNELFEGNFFLGGTLSGGCPATNDATLGTRDQTLKNNWWSSYTAGYNAAGCDRVTLDGNFMFRPMHSDGDKYFANRSAVYFAQRRGKDTNPCRPGVTFTNNTYWGNVDLVEEKKGAGGAEPDTTNGFRAEWYAGGGNVYLPNDRPPDRNYTAVRKNTYRPGSCNVYVANFLDAATVPVDLSTCGLSDGARFEIRSIYNYMGAPVGTGTYSTAAPKVDFPMTPAANPIANSVGHLEGGAPGSYPDMAHSLTKAGGNIFRNAFVVLTSGAPTAPAGAAKP